MDRYNPGLTQIGKSRKCRKKLRKSKSPTRKGEGKRPKSPCYFQVKDTDESDDLTAIQYLCMTCIAEGQGAPVDINLLDLVDMSKAFAQTSTTTAKQENSL